MTSAPVPRTVWAMRVASPTSPVAPAGPCASTAGPPWSRSEPAPLGWRKPWTGASPDLLAKLRSPPLTPPSWRGIGRRSRSWSTRASRRSRRVHTFIIPRRGRPSTRGGRLTRDVPSRPSYLQKVNPGSHGRVKLQVWKAGQGNSPRGDRHSCLPESIGLRGAQLWKSRDVSSEPGVGSGRLQLTQSPVFTPNEQHTRPGSQSVCSSQLTVDLRGRAQFAELLSHVCRMAPFASDPEQQTLPLGSGGPNSSLSCAFAGQVCVPQATVGS